MLRAQSVATRLDEDLAVPAPIGSPRVLERLVGLCDLPAEIALERLAPPARGHVAAEQQQQQHRGDRDQDDSEGGHAASLTAWPAAKPLQKCSGPPRRAA